MVSDDPWVDHPETCTRVSNFVTLYINILNSQLTNSIKIISDYTLIAIATPAQMVILSNDFLKKT